jgi:glutamate 5-kinase
MSDQLSARRVVIKIGSALLTAAGGGLHRERIRDWSQQIASLKGQGLERVVVSSGAIAEGMTRLGWSQRPGRMDALQMAAAVGQIGLLACWEQHLSASGIYCGQVLLSREDMTSRDRYLNAHAVLARMLHEQVVPVINENDAVAIDEIRMGDNDTLAARVVNLLGADLLLILTDQQGIYERDPRSDPKAVLIERARIDDPRLDLAASAKSGAMGRGGARTKIAAAKLAARSASSTVIAHGLSPGIIERVIAGEAVGTLIEATQDIPDSARKRWLVGLERHDSLVLDEGAVAALGKRGNSLLAVGVRAAQGQFKRGDPVSCIDTAGREIACGLSNYSHIEMARIAGKGSDSISKMLGYTHGDEVIHRDNLIFLT